MNPKISIIIPCYNAEHFLFDTIQSILIQNYSNIEIIIVDDGSVDQSNYIIKKINNSIIKYIYQKNLGVSAARNNGYFHADGEYVVFFDADDMMSEKFLSSRVNYLETNSKIDFVGGPVIKFNDAEVFNDTYNAVGNNPIEEILFYDKSIVTCPSNYMFRKQFLDKYEIKFNNKLSSTADRFFLIECAQYSNSIFLTYITPLMYRISENSMSHLLTNKLVNDNVVFYRELVNRELIPVEIKRNSLFLGYYILFGSYWKINRKYLSIKFALKSFSISPIKFIYICSKKFYSFLFSYKI